MYFFRHPGNWETICLICCCSVTKLCRFFATPCTAAHQASLSFTISWSLLKLMSVESVMLLNHFISCHPLLLPSVFPNIRIFSNELTLHIRWPKYWSFSFSINPSNGYSRLISFRIDWFELAVQQSLQESSPAPQLQSISSLALSLYGSTLTPVCDYWKFAAWQNAFSTPCHHDREEWAPKM